MTTPAFYGITLLVLYAVVIVEVLYLQRRDGQPAPWRELVVNMNSGQMMLWVLRGVRVVAYTFLYQHLSLHWLDALPSVVLVPLALVLWDLAFYTSHYAHHKLPWLWEVHVLHHHGEAFNISLAVRNAWLQVLTPLPFFAVLAILGIPPELYFSVGAVHYIVQLYNHNDTVRDSGVLDTFMVTPTHHKVHHAKNARYLDRNFGSSLIIWDKLFGTFAKEDPSEPVVVGIDGAPRSEHAGWLNLEPLTRRLGLGGPDDQLPAVRHDFGDGWLVVGSVLHFAWMCVYVMAVPDWTIARSVLVFLLVFGGTMLLGGAADGRRRSVLAWAVLSTVGGGLYVSLYSDFTVLEQLCVALLALHGVWRVPRWVTTGREYASAVAAR